MEKTVTDKAEELTKSAEYNTALLPLWTEPLPAEKSINPPEESEVDDADSRTARTIALFSFGTVATMAMGLAGVVVIGAVVAGNVVGGLVFGGVYTFCGVGSGYTALTIAKQK